ncbi:hypothetical protein GR216_31890 [Rhizobium leguminosarum]|nr:hypothetical protein [Rhizobium ruizarguesonis]NEJ39690.1 hypothetical protein [Rhizobium ruizarguesonis]
MLLTVTLMSRRERENRELRQANEVLRKASVYYSQAELDRPPFGARVDPIRKLLPIAPSTSHEVVAKGRRGVSLLLSAFDEG